MEKVTSKNHLSLADCDLNVLWNILENRRIDVIIMLGKLYERKKTTNLSATEQQRLDVLNREASDIECFQMVISAKEKGL